MGNLIQITGLPRSGTAFVATFLALHPECVSFHELIMKSDDYRKKILYTTKTNKFVVDSSTYGFLPQCTFKESKKVYIERDFWESKNSLERALKLNIDEKFYYDNLIEIKKWKEENLVYQVKFKELFKVETLERLWQYCFGSLEYFVREKAELFLDMNIQIKHPEIVLNKTIFDRINKQLCQR